MRSPTHMRDYLFFFTSSADGKILVRSIDTKKLELRMIEYVVFGTIGVGVFILVALITSFPREPDNVRLEKSFLGESNPLPSFTDAAEVKWVRLLL
jgi:hypothetical protein